MFVPRGATLTLKCHLLQVKSVLTLFSIVVFEMKKLSTLFLACAMAGLTACGNDTKSDISNGNGSTPAITQPTLVGFARLDVESYAEGPHSGAAVKGAYGIYPPFPGQPIQGFSAALKNPDGSYMAMADNGFGTQDNSADFLLRIYQLKANFKTKSAGSSQVHVQRFIQLRDPLKKIPFDIVNQDSAERLLTGADFDPESMQRAADGSYWIGEEFGPYLLHFDAEGVLLEAPYPLPDPLNAGKELRSPQNQFNKANINFVEAQVKQSGGFEGMALSQDGRYLYPILEKPLLREQSSRVLISQFDLKSKVYTGKYFWYEMDPKGGMIGDFQMFSADQGIIIERDGSQNDLNGYKKLIHVKLGEVSERVTRSDLVDLMNIDNPDLLFGLIREGDIGVGKKFSFPFETVEDVIIEDARTLTIFNDNNFPGSAGRNKNRADDNEIIQIRLPKPLY